MCPFAAPLAKDIKVFTLSVHDALQWDDVDRDLDLCELWAGVGSVSKAAARRKLKTSCLDILLLPGDDVTTLTGFRKTLAVVQRLRPGGLLMMGPPCSSFVWMNSSACKRNAVGDFKGDVSYERVHDGNVQAEVAVFMFVYALHRHVVPVLENPQKSMLWKYSIVDTMRAALHEHLHEAIAFRCSFSSGDEGNYRKPYKFVSSSRFVLGLERPCTCSGPHDEMSTKLEDGRRRGNTAALKASAAYPAALGECIVDLWTNFDGPEFRRRANLDDHFTPAQAIAIWNNVDGRQQLSKVKSTRSKVKSTMSPPGSPSFPSTATAPAVSGRQKKLSKVKSTLSTVKSTMSPPGSPSFPSTATASGRLRGSVTAESDSDPELPSFRRASVQPQPKAKARAWDPRAEAKDSDSDLDRSIERRLKIARTKAKAGAAAPPKKAKAKAGAAAPPKKAKAKAGAAAPKQATATVRDWGCSDSEWFFCCPTGDALLRASWGKLGVSRTLFVY